MIAARRSLLLALALPLLLLSATPLAAQGPPRDAPQGPRADAGPEQAVKVVAHTLQLSETQIDQWVEILQGLREAVRPLARSVAEHERALAELVESDDPDPAGIGSLVLEIRGLRRQIYELYEQATADFEALLDEQQLDRLSHIRQVAPVARVLPAFQALHLL